MEGPVPGLGPYVSLWQGLQPGSMAWSACLAPFLLFSQCQPECFLEHTKLGPGWSIRLGALLLHHPLARPCCCTTPWHGLAAAPALGMALLQHQPLGRPCCSTSPWEGLAAAPALGRALLLHQPLGGPCCCTSLGGPCCCTSPWEALVAAPVWEGLVAAPTLGTALLQHQPYAFLLHPASCLQQCACLAAV